MGRAGRLVAGPEDLDDTERADIRRRVDAVGELEQLAVALVQSEAPEPFAGVDDATLRAVALRAYERVARTTGYSVGSLLAAMIRRATLGWTAAEVIWMLAVKPPDRYWLDVRFGLPIAAAESLDADGLARVRPMLEKVVEEAAHEGNLADRSARRRMISRLRELIDRVPAAQSTAELPDWVLPAGEPLSDAVRAEHREVLESPGVPELLVACTRQQSVTPSARWLKEAIGLRDAAPRASDAIRALLERFGADPAGEIGEDNETLLRSLVWTVADVDEEWVTPSLAAVTVSAASAPKEAPGIPNAPRLAASAILVLAGRPGDLPVRTLQRLALTVRNNALRTRLHAALEQLGAGRGWSPGAAAERPQWTESCA